MTRFVRTAVIVILVVGFGGSFAARAWRESHKLSAGEIAEIPERLAQIPLETDDPKFRGERDYLEPETVKLSGADHYAAVDYVAEDGGTVRLHIGAAARTDAWFHVPTVCLPAHGWTMERAKLTPIWEGLAGVDAGAKVWRMKLHKAARRCSSTTGSSTETTSSSRERSDADSGFGTCSPARRTARSRS